MDEYYRRQLNPELDRADMEANPEYRIYVEEFWADLTAYAESAEGRKEADLARGMTDQEWTAWIRAGKPGLP
jgi:hypothetical protein